MADDRPQKQVVRRLWADAVEAAANRANVDVPLYLTLPGAEARDIDVLVERNLVRLEETGAVSEEDGRRIVALESRDDAYLRMIGKYPGIDHKRQNVSDLLRGPEPTVFPDGIDFRRCRAAVVN